MDCFLHAVAKTEKIEELSQQVIKSPIELITYNNQELFAEINDAINKLTVDSLCKIQTSAKYRATYAHGLCYLLCSALSLFDLRMVAIVEEKSFKHWLNIARVGDHNYFIDAYGFFQTIDAIEKRYSIVDSEVLFFDWENDQLGLVDALSSLHTSLRDQIENDFIAQQGKSIDQDDINEYEKHIQLNLVKELFSSCF